MTRLRDHLAGFATVEMPDGPPAYRRVGQLLRLLALLTYGPVLLTVVMGLAVLPFVVFMAVVFWEAGIPFGVVFTALGAAVAVGLVAALVGLLVVNHLVIGWARQATWALWGTRLVTLLAALGGLGAVIQGALDGSGPAAQGVLFTLFVAGLTGAVHLLSWRREVVEAFREDEVPSPEVDAVLEAEG